MEKAVRAEPRLARRNLEPVEARRGGGPVPSLHHHRVQVGQPVSSSGDSGASLLVSAVPPSLSTARIMALMVLSPSSEGRVLHPQLIRRRIRGRLLKDAGKRGGLIARGPLPGHRSCVVSTGQSEFGCAEGEDPPRNPLLSAQPFRVLGRQSRIRTTLSKEER